MKVLGVLCSIFVAFVVHSLGLFNLQGQTILEGLHYSSTTMIRFSYLLRVFNLIQASRVSRFRCLGNALWDRRSRKVSTNSRISAITEYSFQLRISLPPIYAVFFLWNTSVTPFILVSNSMNW